MQDNNIIHTLSSSTINQIAAGEVVQRPSSVVKELMENSIDAGATKIDVIICDAGRTFIQVIDNGKGMSADDSVKAFERHATSKISDAQDLFALTTMGFRGEALASIAAVSRVEMKTRRGVDELGSKVEISGGELVSQELITMTEGTQIVVKDLFFNIPVRRKFLKTDDTELRNIVGVFQQIALVYPSVRFTLTSNGSTLFNLGKENFRQRIVSVFGEKVGKDLIPIGVDTILARISGFISNPESSVKKGALQYFFVNGRYIQHPYFSKALSVGYDKIIPSENKPQFFLYFDVEPDKIDVNIHPTKTEVKFEDEQALFPIIVSAVKDALASSCSIPSLDFDQEDKIEIPVGPSIFDSIKQPPVTSGRSYNPFSSVEEKSGSYYKPQTNYKPETNYASIMDFEKEFSVEPKFKGFIFGDKYIVSASDDGLLLINIYRAKFRLLYNRYSKMIKSGNGAGQSLLFPELLEFNQMENIKFQTLKQSFESVGYMFNQFGQSAWQIVSVPSIVSSADAKMVITDLIADSSGAQVEDILREKLLLSLAEKGATIEKIGSQEEAAALVKSLFETEMPSHTPNGNPIYFKMDSDSIKNKIG